MKSESKARKKSKSSPLGARSSSKSGKKRKVEKPEKITEEETSSSEDYCFVCKDGGLLIVCDHKDCIKSYHPECVGKEESFGDTGEDWICDWHLCFICSKSSRYKCICCPKAVCQSCTTRNADFARLRGQKGLCGECLKLAVLVEEGLDFDSDGENIDFKDRETYEGLFREYWEIINEKERFTLEDLHSADARLKKGEKVRSHPRMSDSDSDEFTVDGEKQEDSSDADDGEEAEEHEPLRKANRSKPSIKGQKGSTKIEFVGWASKSLLEFLASIGKDTDKQLTQDDVASIIIKYVQENKLFHPDKRKKVVCDKRLFSVLGRKLVNVYKINDLLEAHFLENLDLSEEEEQEHSLEDDIENDLFPSQKGNWSSVRSFQQKESVSKKDQIKETKSEDASEKDLPWEVSVSRFASVVPRNIKLVYLKRSLVEDMLKQPESLECKVVGSFVRVKSATVDRKQSHQLLQVTGFERISADDTKMDIFLKVSSMPKAIPISMLSNDDFTEEECDDLSQKVKDGLLEKLTVVELQKKASILHEDITKHWIARELVLLKNRIDLANEKGWRGKLFEYLERRQQLESPEEQSRMLQEVPRVIAEIIELDPLTNESPHRDSPEKLGAPQTVNEGRLETPISEGSGDASNIMYTPGEEKVSQSFIPTVVNAGSMGSGSKGKGAASRLTSSENDRKFAAFYTRHAKRQLNAQ
ncbi:hypothetical protein Dimus_011978 [Dionaea muscipula]